MGKPQGRSTYRLGLAITAAFLLACGLLYWAGDSGSLRRSLDARPVSLGAAPGTYMPPSPTTSLPSPSLPSATSAQPASSAPPLIPSPPSLPPSLSQTAPAAAAAAATARARLAQLHQQQERLLGGYLPAPPPPAASMDRLAFLTLLASRDTNVSLAALGEDWYFQSIRLLVHRVLRHPPTRTNLTGAEFVVAVIPEVPRLKREILAREGARVLEVPNDIHPPGLEPGSARWADAFCKLHFWNLTQYDAIAYIDADMFALTNLDGMFDYVRGGAEFASAGEKTPGLPPSMLNAGMFVLRPSRARLESMLGALSRSAEWQGRFMEQNFLSWYWGKVGPAWVRMHPNWNGQWMWDMELTKRYRLAHTKFWKEFPDLPQFRPIKAIFFDAFAAELQPLEQAVTTAQAALAGGGGGGGS